MFGDKVLHCAPHNARPDTTEQTKANFKIYIVNDTYQYTARVHSDPNNCSNLRTNAKNCAANTGMCNKQILHALSRVQPNYQVLCIR